MELKLAKLPDRTPVKIAITVSPQLNRKLSAYTKFYNALHSAEDSDGETVADLIPFMLEAFLESDRGFAKALKDSETNGPESTSPSGTSRCRRGSTTSTPETSS